MVVEMWMELLMYAAHILLHMWNVLSIENFLDVPY